MSRENRQMNNVWAAIAAGAATVLVVAINPPPVVALVAVGLVVAIATPYMTLDSGRFLAMIVGCGFVAVAERALDGRGRTLAEFGGFVVLLSLASRSRRWVMRFQRRRAARATVRTGEHRVVAHSQLATPSLNAPSPGAKAA